MDDDDTLMIAALFVMRWELAIMESGTAVITFDLPQGARPAPGACRASMMKSVQDNGEEDESTTFSLLCVFQDGTPIVLTGVSLPEARALGTVSGLRISVRLHEGIMMRFVVEDGIEGLQQLLEETG